MKHFQSAQTLNATLRVCRSQGVVIYEDKRYTHSGTVSTLSIVFASNG